MDHSTDCYKEWLFRILTLIQYRQLLTYTNRSKRYTLLTSLDTQSTTMPTKPTSPAQLHGAALIASTYHIIITVLPPSSSSHYHTHTYAIDDPAEDLRTRQHRSFRAATNDWKHKHFTWDSTDSDRGLNVSLRRICELERERDEEDKTARDIRNLAQQKGARVPDKQEALAMAWLGRQGRMVVSKSPFLSSPGGDVCLSRC
jgi:hypothetical protein